MEVTFEELEHVYLGMLPGPPVAAAPCRNCSRDHTCLRLFSVFSAFASAAHLRREDDVVRGKTNTLNDIVQSDKIVMSPVRRAILDSTSIVGYIH